MSHAAAARHSTSDSRAVNLTSSTEVAADTVAAVADGATRIRAKSSLYASSALHDVSTATQDQNGMTNTERLLSTGDSTSVSGTWNHPNAHLVHTCDAAARCWSGSGLIDCHEDSFYASLADAQQHQWRRKQVEYQRQQFAVATRTVSATYTTDETGSEGDETFTADIIDCGLS
ncbi:hypothetical protein NESM_000784100 [Novymonas esmeraldas]|uniref:Uncharacterized protein n=1 Tax=Novymonas esmeraldas TaxID=1808958 RepID=A0AAW0EYQ4_9TRYP